MVDGEGNKLILDNHVFSLQSYCTWTSKLSQITNKTFNFIWITILRLNYIWISNLISNLQNGNEPFKET